MALDLSDLNEYIKPLPEKYFPNEIILKLNPDFSIDVTDPNRGMLVLGKKGTGKTTSLTLLTLQFRLMKEMLVNGQKKTINDVGCWIFDPKGDIIRFIENNNFSNRFLIVKLALDNNALIGTKSKLLKLKLSDFLVSALKIVAPTDKSEKDIKIRDMLEDLSQRNLLQTWSLFKESVERDYPKLKYVLNRFSILFQSSKNSYNTSFESLMNRCVIFDVRNMSEKDSSIGLLLANLYEYRMMMADKIGIENLKPFLFVMDEIQKWGKNGTASGEAIGMLMNQGRAFNIRCLLAGIDIGSLAQGIKNNVDTLFLHQMVNVAIKLKKMGLTDRFPEEMKALGVGELIFMDDYEENITLNVDKQYCLDLVREKRYRFNPHNWLQYLSFGLDSRIRRY